ncbi:hypothetical protein BC629DRAFT_1559347 [Irpex lacteus]|nr:hypothetical protein BC629DRAFT_1559347 [Irpex lacteus]
MYPFGDSDLYSRPRSNEVRRALTMSPGTTSTRSSIDQKPIQLSPTRTRASRDSFSSGTSSESSSSPSKSSPSPSISLRREAPSVSQAAPRPEAPLLASLLLPQVVPRPLFPSFQTPSPPAIALPEPLSSSNAVPQLDLHSPKPSSKFVHQWILAPPRHGKITEELKTSQDVFEKALERGVGRQTKCVVKCCCTLERLFIHNDKARVY